MEKTEASLLNKKAGEKKFSTSEIWKNNKLGFHNKWGKVSGTKEKNIPPKEWKNSVENGILPYRRISVLSVPANTG